MKRLHPIILTLLFSFSLWGGDALSGIISAQSAVLMDYETGRILYEKDGNVPIPPASMAKVMTLYLTYDAIREGRLEKERIITIDEVGSSFSRPPRSSLMLLEEGQEVSVLGLMEGLAIASGNDAAYALADLIGPGVDAFVDKMNRKAEELGLRETCFVDPDGWSEYNLVTAEEYALLARHYIQDYPEALVELHSVPYLVYPLPDNMPEDRSFRIKVPRKKNNTNKLLGSYEGIDGLKTGYIDESGFNFSATARRQDTRLISVIMGIRRESYFQGLLRRAEESASLLDYGFDNYKSEELAEPVLPELRVWMGSETDLVPIVPEGAAALLREGELCSVYSMVSLEQQITAPVLSDDIIGSIRYYIGSVLLDEVPVHAGRNIPEGNFFQKLRDRVLQKWMEWQE
ncbi:MAG: hypothetical protein B6241_02875 [Spirochaetaceae bacterium 4572_59]|nr:MAG: hypothetical protein B6241_02875 [Spirochaetaceae bacterium 4572_59]